jgi:hypothetical protein
VRSGIPRLENLPRYLAINDRIDGISHLFVSPKLFSDVAQNRFYVDWNVSVLGREPLSSSKTKFTSLLETFASCS